MFVLRVLYCVVCSVCCVWRCLHCVCLDCACFGVVFAVACGFALFLYFVLCVVCACVAWSCVVFVCMLSGLCIVCFAMCVL